MDELRPPAPAADLPPDPLLMDAQAPPEAAAAGAAASPDDAEEAALGSTPAGLAANEALRGLSRAARSFLMYDPRNEAIRVFLTAYRDAMMGALGPFGAMDLEIRPFEMVRGGEIVYLERDRERSLAFRLFRDGVRRLTITPEVEWPELLRLLEILSIRYTGVRQQEDDIVTLLWKAGFAHIQIAAVEGFVPDEDESEEASAAAAAARAARRDEGHVEVPRDWDQPLPPLPDPVELRYRPVEEHDLEALRAEGSSLALPEQCVQLVEQMLQVVADPTDPTTIDDIGHMIEEVRDFLLSEGQLGYLTRLARSVQSALTQMPSIAEKMLATFANERALRRIVHSIGKGHEDAPPELIELLDLIPADHLSHLIDLLAVERGTENRRIMRQLIGRYASKREAYLLKRLVAAESSVARDLLSAISEALPARAVEAVEAVAPIADTELQFEMLKVLETVPEGDRVRKLLMGLLSAPLEDVRMRALELLIRGHDRHLFPELVKYVESRAATQLQPKEAALIGRTLAELNPRQAQQLLSDWIKPSGLLRRFGTVPGQKMLRWTAVSGIGRLEGNSNEELIRWLAKEAGEDLHKHCMHTLFLRRKEGTVHV